MSNLALHSNTQHTEVCSAKSIGFRAEHKPVYVTVSVVVQATLLTIGDIRELNKLVRILKATEVELRFGPLI